MKKSWIYFALMALILITPAASHGRIDQQIEDMLSTGQHFAIYDDRDFGKSLVSIGYSRNSNPDIAIDMAKQDATKALGSFLQGEKVNAIEVAEQRFDGDRVNQSFYQQMRTSVETSLRSAYLYQSGQYRDKTYAVVVISETGSHADSDVYGAPTSNVVSAKGFSSVKDGRTKARETALNQALRSAVEQYSGVRIVAKTSIENAASYRAKLASVSKGYVKSYQIVREHQDGNNYVVEISATISEGEPNGDTNIDAIKQSLSNSAFYLDFKDTRLKDMIAEILTNNNLNITHTKERAGYVLTGSVKSRRYDVSMSKKMRGYQTTIVVKGVDRISGEVLLCVTNDPENSVDVSKYDEVGKMNSFEYAMEEVEKRLVKEIQGSFVDKFNNGAKVFVKLKGFDFMRDVYELKECIDSLPLTKSVSASPVDGKSVTYEVLYLGNPSDLQLEILKKARDYRLQGLRATSDNGYIGFSF